MRFYLCFRGPGVKVTPAIDFSAIFTPIHVLSREKKFIFREKPIFRSNLYPPFKQEPIFQ